MFRTPTILTALLLIALVAVGGYGYHQTRTVQPAEIAQLEQRQKELIARQAGVEGLMIEFEESREQADLALRRWNARYKVLPTTLTSPAVVDYLNALTNSFHTFDLSLVGREVGQIHSKYTYRASGQAYFGALYGLLWNLENGRGMYRVNDLNINRTIVSVKDPDREEPRDVIMADFDFTVEAYFSGEEGISAPDSLIEVPAAVLPPRSLQRDPFYPFILDRLPPNLDDLVDVESDSLVSVAGPLATFDHGGELRSLRAGDRVYLGRVTSIDPAAAKVVIDLNKGGIREKVEIDFRTGEQYRQAFGNTLLQAATLQGVDPAETAPPAPGTPEAKRAQDARLRRGDGRNDPLPAPAPSPAP